LSQDQSTSWATALGEVRRELTLDIPGYGMAKIPAILPENLGSAAFRQAHGARYALMSGAMANGIASADLVRAMAKAGFVGIYGAAGLSLPEIEKNLDALVRDLGTARNWGVNLIHNPSEPALEWAIAGHCQTRNQAG
jgi:trans-AT polyketide synthase, acyltransferase and oxidoreductase domains